MYVQSSHFIEQEGGDAARKVTFYGQEKKYDGRNCGFLDFHLDEHKLAIGRTKICHQPQ